MSSSFLETISGLTLPLPGIKAVKFSIVDLSDALGNDDVLDSLFQECCIYLLRLEVIEHIAAPGSPPSPFPPIPPKELELEFPPEPPCL